MNPIYHSTNTKQEETLYFYETKMSLVSTIYIHNKPDSPQYSSIKVPRFGLTGGKSSNRIQSMLTALLRIISESRSSYQYNIVLDTGNVEDISNLIYALNDESTKIPRYIDTISRKAKTKNIYLVAKQNEINIEYNSLSDHNDRNIFIENEGDRELIVNISQGMKNKTITLKQNCVVKIKELQLVFSEDMTLEQAIENEVQSIKSEEQQERELDRKDKNKKILDLLKKIFLILFVIIAIASIIRYINRDDKNQEE